MIRWDLVVWAPERRPNLCPSLNLPRDRDYGWETVRWWDPLVCAVEAVGATWAPSDLAEMWAPVYERWGLVPVNQTADGSRGPIIISNFSIIVFYNFFNQILIFFYYIEIKLRFWKIENFILFNRPDFESAILIL